MKTFIYLAVLLCGQTLLAQTADPKSKSFVALSGGYSGLMGNLIKSDYADNTSGYANRSGFNTGVEGAYYFHKYIGIGGVYSYASFATNGLQTLADGYKEDFGVDSTTVNVKGRYSMNNVLAGPYFSFPFKKFTLDIRAVAGICVMKTPEFTTYLEDQENATFSQNAASATAFAYQAGIGLRYALFKNFGVRISTDYFGTNPDFKVSNTNRMNNAGRLITEYHQPVSMLHYNFGLVYQFGAD
jgi:hypothetical protein